MEIFNLPNECKIDKNIPKEMIYKNAEANEKLKRVFIDNVELDYVDSYFAKKTSLLGQAAKWLEKKTVKRDEIDSIQYSDKLVYLTNRDHKRIESLYDYKDEKPTILPVCLPSKQELSIESSIKNIYFIGSLYYDANVDAIENFVHNVWLPYFRDNKNIRLTIAGSKPTLAVKELIKKADNITLIEDFDDVKDFISKGNVMDLAVGVIIGAAFGKIVTSLVDDMIMPILT